MMFGLIIILFFLLIAVVLLFLFNFRNLFSIILGTLFALLIFFIPGLIASSGITFAILGSGYNYNFAYLLVTGLIIFVVYMIFRNEIGQDRTLNFSLGLGLLVGLGFSLIKLFYAR